MGNYEGRCGRYWKFQVDEVAAGARGQADPDQVVEAEGERLLARLPTSGLVVALTRDGRPMSSGIWPPFWSGRRWLPPRRWLLSSEGPSGLAEAVLDRSRVRMSLSAMTLPHELARMVLAEQLYRAGTILRGEPYHKGQDG